MQKNNIAFLVGMPRAATTFLYHNLNLHPNIYIPFRRKTNYFSLHHEKGEEWFISHFSDAPPNSVCVDTETLAFINKNLQSPSRIKAFNPNAKLILCVREPAAWAVSLYDQVSTFDAKIPSFEEFLSGNYTLVEDGIGEKFTMRDGDIAARIQEYEELFPDSLLLLNFRDVTEAPLQALQKIERFLNVPPFYNTGNVITKKINASGRKHNKFLNKLLRNELVISVIRTLLPRKLVLTARWIFDGIMSSGEAKPLDIEANPEKAKNLALAAKHFQSDIKTLAKYYQ